MGHPVLSIFILFFIQYPVDYFFVISGNCERWPRKVIAFTKNQTSQEEKENNSTHTKKTKAKMENHYTGCFITFARSVHVSTTADRAIIMGHPVDGLGGKINKKKLRWS